MHQRAEFAYLVEMLAVDFQVVDAVRAGAFAMPLPCVPGLAFQAC